MSSKPNNPEPFGYFRALPWCWEDCAATDEGARALYDEDAIRTQAARIAELEAEVERLRKPLTDEQIEALPVWSRFVGLWPETRKDIARAIEAAKEGK